MKKFLFAVSFVGSIALVALSISPPSRAQSVQGGAAAGISLAAGVGTFLQSPSSANLLAALTDKTGTGLVTYNTAPSFPTTITLASTSGTTAGGIVLGLGGQLYNSAAGRVTLNSPGSRPGFYFAEAGVDTAHIETFGGTVLIDVMTSGQNIKIRDHNGSTIFEFQDTGRKSLARAGLYSSDPTAGLGYATLAGGTIVQATSKSTGVTLNKVCGQITMNAAALGNGAAVAFTLTDSAIAATDVVRVSIASGGTSAAYLLSVTATAAGSCEITVYNCSGAPLSEALVLNFAVFKSVTS